jgi:endonuclease/exonuclease/phosphatase family metal-dependent hydrolase
MRSPEGPSLSITLLQGILFLSFFQLLTDFVEAIYAFGLLGTSIPPEIAAVLVLFSPLLLLFFPRGTSAITLVVLGELALLARMVEPLLETRGRMLVSGFGVGFFLVFFPALLWNLARREKTESIPASLGAGLALGVSLTVFFRVLNSGVDLSTSPELHWIAWPLFLLAGVLLVRDLARQPAGREDLDPVKKKAAIITLVLGLASVWVLLYFAFLAPNVIARWTGASYLLVVFLASLSPAAFCILSFARPRLLADLPFGAVLAGNLLFVLALVLTILPHQLAFPLDPLPYPLFEPAVPPLAQFPLVVMLALCPILLIDFQWITRALLIWLRAGQKLQSTSGGLRSFQAAALAFSLASLYLLVMIFAHVFTTVYDYIPIVGPLFRDKFWLVHLIPGSVLILAFLASRPVRSSAAVPGDPGTKDKKVNPMEVSFLALVAALVLAALAVAMLASPRPVPPEEQASLRVLTYNIQQGYSAGGQKEIGGQLDLIRRVDPDILGLQESDTNRIAGGNTDVVRYFANKLALYSYYGPKTITGTFGIALLSKYPIKEPRTYFLYSVGEQTAAIAARVTTGERTFNVFVTHLGNGGPLIQQQQFLETVQRAPDVIAMGDFNFRPDTEQYRLTTGLLADAWLLRWPQGVDDRGMKPTDRIDHFFISPNMTVLDIRYLPDPASDHPAVYMDIKSKED